MLDFIFYNPVKLVFGAGSVEKLGKLLQDSGPVMLVAGKNAIRAHGIHERIQSCAKVPMVEFFGIEPNPQMDTLMQAVEMARKNQIGFLLAAGGGSVIDGAKFIAAAACHPQTDPWDLVTMKVRVREALPMGAVLTLPGTGSEMNDGAVISRKNPDDKRAFKSPKVFPQFAVLDPDFTLHLPWRYTANGIVDAFVHVMEQYCTFDVHTPLQDRMSEGILSTLVECGEKIRKNPQDPAVRADIMWCATLALNRLIGCGVIQDWSTHLIGHAITAVTGMDHARSLAAVLPTLLRHQQDKKQEKLAQLGRRVFFVPADMPDREAAEQAILRLEAFFLSLGVAVRLDASSGGSENRRRVIEILDFSCGNLGEHKDMDAVRVSRILEDATLAGPEPMENPIDGSPNSTTV